MKERKKERKKTLAPECNRRIWQQLFVFIFRNLPSIRGRSRSICITLNLGVPLCRWIKYRGIKICGSGFLSSVASALLGNCGHDNRPGKQETGEERGWYTKGGEQRKVTHTNDGRPVWANRKVFASRGTTQSCSEVTAQVTPGSLMFGYKERNGWVLLSCLHHVVVVMSPHGGLLVFSGALQTKKSNVKKTSFQNCVKTWMLMSNVNINTHMENAR